MVHDSQCVINLPFAKMRKFLLATCFVIADIALIAIVFNMFVEKFEAGVLEGFAAHAGTEEFYSD